MVIDLKQKKKKRKENTWFLDSPGRYVPCKSSVKKQDTSYTTYSTARNLTLDKSLYERERKNDANIWLKNHNGFWLK